MSDPEDATDARLDELFKEPQDDTNVPTPDNANILAPGTTNIILAPDNADLPARDNVPEPSSSENDTHDSTLDVPSSPSELSEERRGVGELHLQGTQWTGLGA